jgi:hypothetical protein
MEPEPPDLRSKSSGGVAGAHPPLARLPVVVGPSTGSELNTIKAAIIPIACWRLDDVRFAFDSSFVQPQAEEECHVLKALREEHKLETGPPGAVPPGPAIYPRVSIFGHADPVGDDDYNKQLSGRRATAIYALLTRDTGLWEELHSSPLGNDNWGGRSIQVMLEALGFSPGPADSMGRPETQDAIRSFQTSAGLPATGEAHASTRKMLFQAYMDHLCGKDFKLNKVDDFLAGTDPGGKGDYQGCSEFNPVLLFSQQEEEEFSKSENKQTRNEQNAPNRRVMVLLFQPLARITASKWPCPRAKEGTGACRKRFWSDGEQRRTKHLPDERREFRKTADTFACRFYHRLTDLSPCEQLLDLSGSHISVLLRSNSGAVPLTEIPYRIILEDGLPLEGKTGTEGLIQHEDVPPGDYELELKGEKVEVLVPTLPKHMDRRTLRVPNFFLFDDQPPGDLPVIDPNEDVQAGGGGTSDNISV